MAAGGEGDTKVYGLHPRHRGGAPRIGSIRHLAARERPAGRTTPYSDEGLRQARLRFRKGARIVQSVEDLVRISFHHRARTDRARGADRLRSIRFLQQPAGAVNRAQRIVASGAAGSDGREDMGRQQHLELGAAARAIIDSNFYMTLGTADEEGRPWVSPVYYAAEGYAKFYWVSSP